MTGGIGVPDTDDAGGTLRELLGEIADKYDRAQGMASEALATTHNACALPHLTEPDDLTG